MDIHFTTEAVNDGGKGLGPVKGVRINLTQHEADELFSTILLSDSPVAKDIADKLQPYAKKVSFR